MIKKLIYLSLIALLASCHDDVATETTVPTANTAAGSGQMIFQARAATLTRASSNGTYNQSYYPVNKLFLTAFHRDKLNTTQWYFTDIMLDATNAEGVKLTDYSTVAPDNRYWTATGWYWPIQGKMELLSYWCPKIYGAPSFYGYMHGDDENAAQMVVNSRGTAVGDSLDAKTDFLYIADNNIPCPQNGSLGITYRHGLAWITLSLRAEVLKKDALGNNLLDASGKTILDTVETQKLIEKVHVQKIIIEDVARNAKAYLVPGMNIAWKIDPKDVYDQVYYRPKGATTTRGNYGYFEWKQHKDGSQTIEERDYITLSATKQYLGLYIPELYQGNPDAYQPENDSTYEYIGNGLLLIPQHKTAITVYYEVVNGKYVGTDGGGNPIYKDLTMIERYDLHDNNLEWEAGKRYNYDIIFKTPADEQPAGIEIVPTTYSIEYGTDNHGFSSEAFGPLQIKVEDGAGNVTYQEYLAPVFVLPPLHDQGSPFEDEMDYRDGGNI